MVNMLRSIERMAAEHKNAVERAKANAEEMIADCEALMDRMNEGHQKQVAVYQERVNAANGGGGFPQAMRELLRFLLNQTLHSGDLIL
jgi:hypothetical protein